MTEAKTEPVKQVNKAPVSKEPVKTQEPKKEIVKKEPEKKAVTPVQTKEPEKQEPEKKVVLPKVSFVVLEFSRSQKIPARIQNEINEHLENHRLVYATHDESQTGTTTILLALLPLTEKSPRLKATVLRVPTARDLQKKLDALNMRKPPRLMTLKRSAKSNKNILVVLFHE